MNDKTSNNYLANFRLHQESVAAHINGHLNDGHPPLPAFYPPSSYWTSSEKDLFFHALPLYSRFRPDLIADSIKTKSIFDVCIYLEALHVATSREIATRNNGLVRNSMDLALEVSDGWIEREEEIAKILNDAGSCRWTVDDNNEAETSCICTADMDHASLKNDATSGDNLKCHLDSTCLMVLETIIRAAEREGGELKSSPPSLADCEGTETALPTQPMSTGDLVPTTSENASLDPETSLTGLNVSVPASKAPVPETAQVSDDHGFDAQRRLQKRLYMRRKRAQYAGTPINTEAARLRPGRQTRDRKLSKPRPKTYNTKRRSIFPRGGANSAEQTPVEIAVLQEDREPSLSQSLDEIDDDDESVNERRSKGGIRKPDRIRKLFLENSIDAQKLSDMNLDFFHLSTLARLMRLYSSLNDSTRALNNIAISTDTIQLLISMITEFTSEVIRRAVVSKEQEVRLKGRTKVWKYDQTEISVENVKQSLKTMGLGHLDLKKYFAKLTGEGWFVDDGEPPSENVSDVEMDGTDMGLERSAVGGADAESELEAEVPAPNLLAPDFTFPESFRAYLLPGRRGLLGNDDLLDLEFDEDGFQQELQEEAELDDQDLSASKEYESRLWQMEAQIS
ncbi:hypothetical protein B0H34DRAFT_699506 [Crassisporium funariophilum]|nr:hypothetical protein B0H34DRAFT_699506 [Crassisporium funariophilum]